MRNEKISGGHFTKAKCILHVGNAFLRLPSFMARETTE